MKTLKILIAIVILIAPLSILHSQQQKEMTPEQQAMMKAYMDAATPGAPHKAMQNLVGTWNSTIKMYDNPGTPTESKGKSTFTSILDGRYVQEHAEGNFNGMPFNGYGTFGYDNVSKKYVGSWIDSMGTGIMQSTGSSPDNGTTINWEGTSSDPISGKTLTFHSMMKMVNKDQYHFEMNGPGPDGKEMKMMEIDYNRAN
jgi:uncharacterized protein DUF1579